MSTPLGAVNWTGHKFGSIEVVKLANSSPRQWLLRCEVCKSEWPVPERILSQYNAAGLPIPCRLETCRYGRLPERKISAHERWLNSPEPIAVTQPEPVKAEPIQRVEPVSTDFLRYAAACQKTGTPSVPFREFQQLGPNLHRDIMARVATVEEKE
jgi:hypothetical protein